MRIPVAPVVLLGLASTAWAAPPAAPAEAARSLNAESKASLGISLRAASFLFSASAGSYLLKDSLIQAGSWPYLQELEGAGYVSTSSFVAAEGEFVQISLTPQGQQVLDALAEP